MYVDGARLGSALAVKESNLTLKDMCDFQMHFVLVGLKWGSYRRSFSYKNQNLKEDFRYNIKQKGALLAKGRVLGIQFEELFKDNLYFDLANHANEMASILTKGLKDANCKFLWNLRVIKFSLF